MCAWQFRMSRYGVTPNMMCAAAPFATPLNAQLTLRLQLGRIVPPQLGLYMALAPYAAAAATAAAATAAATADASTFPCVAGSRS